MSSNFAATNAGGYELMMGRWSRLLAEPFLDFIDLPEGATRILDVGCGTGSLTRAIAARTAADVVGIDVSTPFIEYARASTDDERATYGVQDAASLSFGPESFDAALSLLVLNFIPEYKQAVSEMVRVTRRGGTLAAASWGLAGGLVSHRMFWDTAAVLDPAASVARGRAFAAPLTRRNEAADLLREQGLVDVKEADLTIWMRFENFDDYWTPFTLGQALPGAYVAGLDEPLRERLRAALYEAFCAGRGDGPREFSATAHAAKGRKA
jgi:SAM-dependent methyltransferase